MFRRPKRKTAYQAQTQSDGQFTGLVDDVAHSTVREGIVEIRLCTGDDVEITAFVGEKGREAQLAAINIEDTVTVKGRIKMGSSQLGHIYNAEIVGVSSA